MRERTLIINHYTFIGFYFEDSKLLKVYGPVTEEGGALSLAFRLDQTEEEEGYEKANKYLGKKHPMLP